MSRSNILHRSSNFVPTLIGQECLIKIKNLNGLFKIFVKVWESLNRVESVLREKVTVNDMQYLQLKEAPPSIDWEYSYSIRPPTITDFDVCSNHRI